MNPCNEYFLFTLFSHSATCFLEWNFDSMFRITDLRITVVRIINPRNNNHEWEMARNFFSLWIIIIDYCTRFFHFPRTQVIRESVESSGERSACFRVRCAACVAEEPPPPPPPRLPPPPPPTRFARSNPRIVNDPGETLAVTKRLSPPLSILYRVFHADFFL